MAAVATQAPSQTSGTSCGMDDNSCAASAQTSFGSDDSLPSKAALDKAGDLTVQDADGNPHTFRSLYADTSKRTLVIFVRHFYCGLCIDYLRAVSTALSPTTLSSLHPPTQLLVIGCGSADIIPIYVSKTSCPFPIYADHSRKLYDALGMGSTYTLGPRPRYQASSTVDTIVRGFVDIATSGAKMFRSGNYTQIGGEFLFDEGGKVVWCHRMRNTRDHTEVGELRRMLGIEE